MQHHHRNEFACSHTSVPVVSCTAFFSSCLSHLIFFILPFSFFFFFYFSFLSFFLILLLFIFYLSIILTFFTTFTNMTQLVIFLYIYYHHSSVFSHLLSLPSCSFLGFSSFFPFFHLETYSSISIFFFSMSQRAPLLVSAKTRLCTVSCLWGIMFFFFCNPTPVFLKNETWQNLTLLLKITQTNKKQRCVPFTNEQKPDIPPNFLIFCHSSSLPVTQKIIHSPSLSMRPLSFPWITKNTSPLLLSQNPQTNVVQTPKKNQESCGSIMK